MRIGFIGLGNMGGPMALNLIKAGHKLAVNDVRRAAAEPHLAGGANFTESLSQLAGEAELVMTSLPGPKEVEAVVLGSGGLLESMAKGTVYADLSTNSPTLIRRLSARLAERGIAMLDAPVSGGVSGARAGTLAVMVGGEEAVFDQIKPAFDAIGDKVSYVGASGAGTVAKLVHNMLSICTTQLMAEAFTLGVKAGVEPQTLLTAIQNGAYGQGLLLRLMMPKMVFRENFDRVSFALKLARKDLGLATELGRELNVPMALANTVEQDLLEGLVRGLGDKDAGAAFLVQEARAGVKVRA